MENDNQTVSPLVDVQEPNVNPAVKPSYIFHPTHPHFKKFFLPVLGAFVLMVGLGVSLSLVRQRQNIVSQASENLVDLPLIAPVSVSSGQEFTITITIDTHTYKVSAVDLKLNLPTNLEYISLTSTDFLTTVLQNPTLEGNILHAILGSGTTPKQGVGVLATARLKAKSTAAGAAVVSINAGSLVAGIDTNGQAVNTSLLGDTGSASINIVNEIESTPTPTPTASPTPTPTASPTPTPTAQPCTQDTNPCNPVSCSYNLSLCNSSPTPTPTAGTSEPNNCGGTCGSYANCKVGLFCSNSRCRNFNCPSETDCVCSTMTAPSTPTPTPKSRVKTTTQPTPLATTITGSIMTKPSPEVPNLPSEYTQPTPSPKPNIINQIASFFSNLFKRLFGRK